MVFVLSADRKPLDPCPEARARQLLSSGRAAVLRQQPFIIILKDRWSFACDRGSYRLKIDPGSRFAGLAIVNEKSGKVVWAAEVEMRGWKIHKAMDQRRGCRRCRRSRHTRYRPPRFLNRSSSRRRGRLAPSILHRVLCTDTWMGRLIRWCPITAISIENVKFDTQLMENPDIEGVEYQQGRLWKLNAKEYLLEKWGRECAYCGASKVPLQVEHIVPEGKGGTDRISNLTLSCEDCNQRKYNMSAEQFLATDRKARNYQSRLKKEKKLTFWDKWKSKSFLKDVAATNSIRNALVKRAGKYGLPVELGSGALTKYNRSGLGFPKAHWIDAACVGWSTPAELDLNNVEPLVVKSMGHGTRKFRDVYGTACMGEKQASGVVKMPGFPRSQRKCTSAFGFRTGDIVKAVIPKGKYRGTHVGRIVIRASGQFKLRLSDNTMIPVNQKYCVACQRNDGYSYYGAAVQK